MKILFKIIAIFVGLALLVPVIGLLLPREYFVVREITIEAPPEEIFSYIDNPSQRKAWSPYQGPQTKTTFEGPEAGVGARMNWKSPNSSGHIIITESEPPNEVAYETHFDGDYPTSTSRFLFEPVDGGKATRVVWEFWGEVPFHPLRRYYVLKIDESTGGTHLVGLENIKEAVEGKDKMS